MEAGLDDSQMKLYFGENYNSLSITQREKILFSIINKNTKIESQTDVKLEDLLNISKSETKKTNSIYCSWQKPELVKVIEEPKNNCEVTPFAPSVTKEETKNQENKIKKFSKKVLSKTLSKPAIIEKEHKRNKSWNTSKFAENKNNANGIKKNKKKPQKISRNQNIIHESKTLDNDSLGNPKIIPRIGGRRKSFVKKTEVINKTTNLNVGIINKKKDIQFLEKTHDNKSPLKEQNNMYENTGFKEISLKINKSFSDLNLSSPKAFNPNQSVQSTKSAYARKLRSKKIKILKFPKEQKNSRNGNNHSFIFSLKDRRWSIENGKNRINKLVNFAKEKEIRESYDQKFKLRRTSAAPTYSITHSFGKRIKNMYQPGSIKNGNTISIFGKFPKNVSPTNKDQNTSDWKAIKLNISSKYKGRNMNHSQENGYKKQSLNPISNLLRKPKKGTHFIVQSKKA